MKPSRRVHWALLALLSVLTLLIGACSSDDGGDEGSASETSTGPVDLSKVTLKVGDQKAISIQVLLQASGKLVGAPYKVEYSEFTAGPPLVEAANAGGIDLAQVGNTPAIFGAAAKAKIKIIGALEATGKGDAIVVGKDSALKSPADLKGKKVAVTKGSSANANLLLHLKKAGLSLTDITPVYLPPGDGYTALTKGDVDAWAVWDPYTAIAEKEAGAKLIGAADTAGNGYNFWIASDKSLGDPAKKAAIRDFLKRYAEATTWSEQNLDEWTKKYAQLTEISEDASRTTWTRSIKKPTPITDRIVASEQDIADAFTDAKQFPGKVDVRSFIDDQFEGPSAG
ncbi:aliphatic sulfonate ABC transporter substrate-binding protein [Gordonia amarae]|uniref:Putative aliphatic sulfonates-binding protein n=2 Tax=Gordonia amarae TaxID=36821 RepID=G7GWI4_9ACTN|nr:ABC transporter substrate-binding protein [Gordonia amarae]MCS3877281.1 sulfonate transport system substrate-binding protein [Gordonia amarae]QHN16051.1 aliphatic sulfonate ABC transporter substrate-binding protein [Gordonia amarae]QHN20619.1 aliphatic sulfonate ABC transporter substrate-binding protein [Gordonia amarae]QHN29471.1 aliphatic sulfonate ABC transporter substrate-binding protein [Gordonia amarae]QHN38247.1 aliphatic sulfonate ABC transporter substrate-binding protein [Gordonia 